jgi:glycosyltransferase involved in cell wall biosynthesis
MSKVLMVLDREFPPDIRVENEIEVLIKDGHDVHIACYTRKNKPLTESIGKLCVHRKPMSAFIYKSSVACLTSPFYFNYWKKFISELLTSQSFDVIHIHDLPLAKVGVWFKKKKNIKLVVDLHENWPAFLKISTHANTFIGKLLSPIFLWHRYERKVLQSVDDIIVVVEEAKTRLTNLKLTPEKIHVVSNTINLTDLNLPNHEKGDDYILYYAGGITFHRGLQNIIHAIHKSQNSKLKFWILGDGSYKNELMKLVDSYSLNDRVIFQGYQPFKIVMEMLAKADYPVIPHLKTEHTDSTIPHKLFQYMYAEKPVISSDCLPIRRILEETGSGIVYPSNDTNYLSELFDRLGSLNYREMGIKGKKAVLEKYNWNFDSEVLINLYKQLLDR